MRDVRFVERRKRFVVQQEFGSFVRDSGMCEYVGYGGNEDGRTVFCVPLVSCGVLRCGKESKGGGVDKSAYVVQCGGR